MAISIRYRFQILVVGNSINRASFVSFVGLPCVCIIHFSEASLHSDTSENPVFIQVSGSYADPWIDKLTTLVQIILWPS